MIHFGLTFNQEMLILFGAGLLFLILLSLVVENRELRKTAKKDGLLKAKQRKIIAFYRTYMLERYGKILDEEKELQLPISLEQYQNHIKNLEKLDENIM